MVAEVSQKQITKDNENREIVQRKRKLMFSAAIAGISFAILVGYVLKNRTSSCDSSKSPESQQGLNGQPGFEFDRSGDVKNPVEKPEQLSEAELLKLVKEAKDAGLMVMGVTQCGWTRRQREMFGKGNSEARREFEKMYIECRDRTMCPNIKGYPSWARGEQIFPGFKDVAKIRELIKEVGPLPPQQQVRDSSLPNEANIPNAKHAVPSAPLPQAVKARDMADVAETKLVQPNDPTESIQKLEDEREAEESIEEDIIVKKEHVRGVSNFPPLNVPDMPGTAPFTIGNSMPMNQFQQGNVPRQSLQNRDPVKDLAAQMASTFEQIAYDASRNPRSSAYATARLPEASQITTGDSMDDKRIYVEKN